MPTASFQPVPKALRGAIGVTGEQLEGIWKDLQALEEIRQGLAERAAGYVVQGEPACVLAEVANTADAGEALDLAACTGHSLRNLDRPIRRHLLCEAGLSIEVLGRLLDVYLAASRQARKHPPMPANGPEWLDVLWMEATSTRHNVYTADPPPCPLRCETIEALAVRFGESPDVLARVTLQADTENIEVHRFVVTVTQLAGFGPMLLRHRSLLAAALTDKASARRAHALVLMHQTGADPRPVATEVVGAAVSAAKTVRQAAEPLLAAAQDDMLPLLRTKAKAGPVAERRLAIEALWRLGGQAETPFLQNLAQDRCGAIQALVREVLSSQVERQAPLPLPALAPVVPPDPHCPLPPAAREAALALWREISEAAQHHAAKHAQHAGKLPPLSPASVEAAVAQLESMTTSSHRLKELDHYMHWGREAALRFVTRPDVQLLHVVRLGELIAGANDHWRRHLVQSLAVKFYFSHQPRITLRDLAAALQRVGRSPDEIDDMLVGEWGWGAPPLLTLEPGAIWPYFAERPALLVEAWHRKEKYSFQNESRRRIIFTILATFPQLPEPFITLLWDAAFNGTKKERALAQTALDRLPGKEERLIRTLSATRAEHRAIAADWLGRLKCPAAVPALRAALAKEKQESAAGTLMSALEALGVPLEDFVSMEGLLKEAKAFLAKGVPQDLAWFPFDRLPEVRWAHNTRRVNPEILQWMILQSHKLGSPEPGPRLRQYTARFERAGAESLGQFVLEAWISQDTIPHTAAEADAIAQKHAAMLGQWAQQSPQYAPPGNASSWYQAAYNSALVQPRGTAINTKGILAVAGASCGRAAAGSVHFYLKTYYGNRPHQCKALLAMLAWIDHPSAVQVLLSVANRFRTAGIRKEAEIRVHELAERRNWTLDELADRSIPTAGFEADGTLRLDYGPRTFVAQLNHEAEITLLNPEGETIKALPEPRQTDDAAKAAAAKKQLSAARKELASVLKLQRERLYEAMCTQRTWCFADWKMFLHQHPIVRSCCQRLVWMTLANGTVTGTFRPLADGSLTDATDNPVTVPDAALIGLAHESPCGRQVAAAWQQHLSDYEVSPLFGQFGKPRYELPERQRQETSLEDFRGYMTEAFKLRGRLTKAGYTRGATGDGGWFDSYQKHFPTLGLDAVIAFSGNSLPEENRPVALHALYFLRATQDSEPFGGPGSGGVALAEVPAVLLAECYYDLSMAAKDGSGFDPEWEKKVH